MQFISEITVNEIDHMGSDARIAAAAKVSTTGQAAAELEKAEQKDGNKGLINYLMSHRHGTPFEHSALTIFVHAPIMVWREWHRHRIGQSYNEESGRYKQLDPVFWIPRPSRKLIPVPEPEVCTGTYFPNQSTVAEDCRYYLHKLSGGVKMCGKCGRTYRYHMSARPYFQPATEETYNKFVELMKDAYTQSYKAYEAGLNLGLAKEASRAVLPVGIYSSCWVTLNPRSIMSFLSLRTHNEDAKYISYPQAEIEEAANKVEEIFKKHWPLTHESFVKQGRVGP